MRDNRKKKNIVGHENLKVKEEQIPLSSAKVFQNICPAGWGGPGQRVYTSLFIVAVLHTTNSAHLLEDGSFLHQLLSAHVYQVASMKVICICISDHSGKIIIPKHPIFTLYI